MCNTRTNEQKIYSDSYVIAYSFASRVWREKKIIIALAKNRKYRVANRCASRRFSNKVNIVIVVMKNNTGSGNTIL